MPAQEGDAGTSTSHANSGIGYPAPISIPFAHRPQRVYHRYPEGLDLSLAGRAKLEPAGLTISGFRWQQQAALLEDGCRERRDPYSDRVFCQLRTSASLPVC